jgi:ribosomal protein S18 acetylase RimI-like enzyme
LVTTTEEFLALYDRQLRTEAETQGAIAVARLGALLLVTFAGGQGFVTYPYLDGTNAQPIAYLVRRVLELFREDPEITQVEWKTRGHDRAPGLHEALLQHGFEPEEMESVMIGQAALLDVDVPLPDGVTLRQVSEEHDVRAMAAVQDRVFDDDNGAAGSADKLLRRLALGDGIQLWVAEAEGQIVGAGRLEPVAGTEFAGIWGGATVEAWRGQGIYRALTAERARSARAAGKSLIHSDSTEYSRPILERSGFIKVTTTTPYHWHR